jgi:hypothetical protein
MMAAAIRAAPAPGKQGSAFVNSEAQLVLEEHDPFQWGIRPDGT